VLQDHCTADTCSATPQIKYSNPNGTKNTHVRLETRGITNCATSLPGTNRFEKRGSLGQIARNTKLLRKLHPQTILTEQQYAK